MLSTEQVETTSSLASPRTQPCSLTDSKLVTGSTPRLWATSPLSLRYIEWWEFSQIWSKPLDSARSPPTALLEPWALKMWHSHLRDNHLIRVLSPRKAQSPLQSGQRPLYASQIFSSLNIWNWLYRKPPLGSKKMALARDPPIGGLALLWVFG